MALEIVVNRARCIATRACLRAADGVFWIVEGASEVVDPGAAPEADVVRAAEECPTHAISVFRDGEQIA
ncbi:MAG: 4Fe-4S domain-containing protein [Acidimicrobiales bacterium]